MAYPVKFSITSSLSELTRSKEKSFDISTLTISGLKGKLELIVGTASEWMQLEFYNQDNQFVCAVNNDDDLVMNYAPQDMWRIHVR
jgi:hypothetical protein